MDCKKFVNLCDLHYGYERRNGHKIPLHDSKAMDIALRFVQNFKPDTIICSGDILDCGVISHHNKNKPGRTEGFRILADAQDCRTAFIEPLEAVGARKLVYLEGNHEDWLNDLEDDIPGLGGLLNIKSLMQLDKWEVIPQGREFNLGKLTFIHGDQLGGGEHVAKKAVTDWERNIRFGHHHTYQVYTKTTPVSNKIGKTGVAVPCLCGKNPLYGEGKANKWLQGINWGYVFNDGTYTDYVSLITNNRMVADGKIYKS